MMPTKYKKTYKKSYKPSYSSGPDTYAYHDIDEHQEQIKGQIAYWHLENYRYIIPNPKVNPGEVNIINYDKPKIFINGKEFIVNNSEQYVNEFGIAMNPDDCQEFKYSIAEVK